MTVVLCLLFPAWSLVMSDHPGVALWGALIHAVVLGIVGWIEGENHYRW